MGLGFLSWCRGSRFELFECWTLNVQLPTSNFQRNKEKGRSFPDCPFLCCKGPGPLGARDHPTLLSRIAFPRMSGRSARPTADHRCNNASTFCGVALACASTDVFACTRICALVRAAVSVAKSASRMALSLAVTFSSATERLLTLDSRISFWNAPSRPRNVETCLIALSMMRWAVVRFPLARELAPPLPSVVRNPLVWSPRLPVETDWMPIEDLSASVTFDPSAKVAPPPVT